MLQHFSHGYLVLPSFAGHSSVVALRRSWNQVDEIQESTSKLEPSFVGRINNQTVNVGRDVILGCQVQTLVSDYKVSLETKVRALLF